MIWEELRKNLIFTGVDASSTDEVFEKLGGALISDGHAKDNYVQGLKEREAEYPTGLDVDGLGVAIPHTPVEYVNDNVICIGVLKNPVEFRDMGGWEDDVPVRLVFMLCFNDPHAHVYQLQRIIAIIQDKAVMQKLTEASDPDSIIEIIKDKEAQLDAEVQE